MAEQNEADTTNRVEGEEPAQGKRRSTGTESEPGVVRIRLPIEISNRVREAISELKLRGVNVTAEDLLADFIGAMPEAYLMDEVLKRTPEEFYIRAAIQIPELREKLARQARKALVKKAAPDPGSDSPQRRKGPRTSKSEGSATGAETEVPA